MILTASIRSELKVAGHVIDESPQILHIFREDSLLNRADSCCGNNLQVDNNIISTMHNGGYKTSKREFY